MPIDIANEHLLTLGQAANTLPSRRAGTRPAASTCYGVEMNAETHFSIRRQLPTDAVIVEDHPKPSFAPAPVARPGVIPLGTFGRLRRGCICGQICRRCGPARPGRSRDFVCCRGPRPLPDKATLTVGIARCSPTGKSGRSDKEEPSRPFLHINLTANGGIVEPGTSGAPLFDDEDRVVGIVSMVPTEESTAPEAHGPSLAMTGAQDRTMVFGPVARLTGDGIHPADSSKFYLREMPNDQEESQEDGHQESQKGPPT
jgi:hypothetical protein